MRLKIATRGSELALTQTKMVARMLQDTYPELSVEIRIFKTKGDRVTNAPLSSVGGEGLFVKELERALVAEEVDLAIHSLKDMPTVMKNGLMLASVLERGDVRDALISKHDGGFKALPKAARIGTSSPRRRAQMLGHRPDLTVVNIRGNLDTRLKKLEETDLDAIVLAAAGLDRMGWGDRITERLSCEIILPAVGQGALAIQTRCDNKVMPLVQTLNHDPTALAVTAERGFLYALSGGCQTPIGAWARFHGEALWVDGLVAATDGAWLVRDTIAGSPDDAEALGAQLAEQVQQKLP